MVLDERTYTLNSVSANASVLDEETWDAIRVGEIPPPPPPPGVEGIITDLRFWNVDKWQTVPPSVAVGSIVGVKATGKNTGYNLDSMTLDVVIIDPDGESIATKTITKDWVGTGVELGIECIATKAKEGIYFAYIELIGMYEGMAYVLKEWEDTIAAKKEFPWTWLGIGAGALGLILLAKPKKKKT